MKAFKKLIPAVGALAVSAILMGTSTYAWFSMNTTVDASNMQVSAKTDNAFLIISQGTTLSGKVTTATSSLNTSLYPTHPITTLTSKNVGTVTNWGTATSDDLDDPNTDAELTPLTTGATLSNYVAKESFMVGIVENSGTVANALRMKTITLSSQTSGITVVVVCGTNLYAYTASDADGMTDKLAEISEVTTTGVQVDVYLYIDGANENVYTSNAANLRGTVSMEFTIEA